MENTTPLPSIANLFKESLDLFKKSFAKFVALIALTLGVFIGSVTAMFGLIMVANSLGNMPLFIASLILILIGLLGLIYLSIRVQITIIHLLYGNDQSRPLLYYWKKSKQDNIVGFFWSKLGMQLIVKGATFLLIIPGVIYSIMFMFTMPIYILDSKKPGFRTSLGKSRTLTNGLKAGIFWRTLGISLPVCIALGILVMGYVFSITVLPVVVSVILGVLLFVIVVFSLGTLSCMSPVLYHHIGKMRDALESKPVSKGFVVGMILLGVILQIVMSSMNLATLARSEQQRSLDLLYTDGPQEMQNIDPNEITPTEILPQTEISPVQ